jgi:hypothetical protein
MPFTVDLRLAWCSHEAAQFACSAFHYSRTLPTGKLVKVGVWEDRRFVGCLLFSRGNSPNIGSPYRLEQREVCELTRVALAPHRSATSRIIAIALRLLRRQSPGLRLIVSFADPRHGHHGGIYQAGGWLYVGLTGRECVIRLHGRLIHPRSVSSRWGSRRIAWLRQNVDATAERVVTEAKHKYLFPLDADLRAQLLPLVRPYPKKRPKEAGSCPIPAGLEGAMPIRPLHHDEEAAHG